VKGRRSALYLAGVVLISHGGLAPAQAPRTIVNFPLRLIDLSVASDTVSGLQILAQPAVTTKQADAKDGLIWLRFDPDSVFEWLNSAAFALSAAIPNAAPSGIQWSRTLRPIGGRGGLAMGRSRKKGALDKSRWLAIGDSAMGWQAELSSAEADSLLRLLLVVGGLSRLDTTATAPPDSAGVDVPVAIVQQPAPRQRGGYGRVAAQFMVGVDGLAEPSSFVAMLASDPALIADAWEVVRRSTFRPAQRAGQPVRQLVRRVLAWFPPR
jgi:hypothetical protein